MIDSMRPVHLDEDDEPDRPAPDGNGEDEKKPTQDPGFSLGKALFEARTILLFGQISQKAAREAIAQLLALAAKGDDPIRMVICSEGGHVEAGDTIHDMIRFIKPRVIMVGTGWVASAGAHIYLSAQREDRYCTPNTRFLLHQPMGGAGGPASDIDIEAREIIKMRRRINEIIARETGQPLEKVEKDTDRNFWMSAREAQEYGLVAHIVESADQIA